MASFRLRCSAIAGLLANACFPPSDGAEPPAEGVHFPVGLALSPDGDRLYVANSNFDLRFKSGRLLALDAARVRALLPDFDASEPCAALGTVLGARTAQTDAERSISPGTCCPLTLGPRTLLSERLNGCAAEVEPTVSDPFELVRASAKISAFATDLVYHQNPDAASGRLFVPTRGDATLHWLDVGDPEKGERAELDCGQGLDSSAPDDDTCDSAHRRGSDDDPTSAPDERLVVEPFGVAASYDGRVLVTTHRTQGRVSLFLNDWASGEEGGPRLVETVAGLPLNPTAIAALPPSEMARSRTPDSASFVVTFVQSPPVIHLLRYFPARDAEPCPSGAECLSGPRLRSVATTDITTTDATDSRGIAFDDSARASCEASCASAPDCLAECEGIAVSTFIANRTPASLLVGKTQPSIDAAGAEGIPEMSQVIPVRTGPSRVVVARVAGVPEAESLRVFLVAFDSRFIYVYDPRLGVVEARIQTGRGPHPFVVDAVHGLGYVGHFTDSNIGVVDLKKCQTDAEGGLITPCRPNPHYGEIVMMIGQPTPPTTSK